MNRVTAGLSLVMKSHCRFLLSRKMLSLYSSEMAIEGVKVTGPRCARGPRSPRSSSGYAAIGTLGVTGVASGAWGQQPPPPGGGRTHKYRLHERGVVSPPA